LQNVPKSLRDIIVAEPEKVLVNADLVGIEWALSMWFASKHDTDGFHLTILDKFQAGDFDPHRYLASVAFNIPEVDVTDEQRRVCKAYTHGRTYLGSPRTLARNAGHSDATGLKVCEAHERAFRVAPWQQALLAEVKKKHYVQTPLGWRRYFWSWDPKPTEVIATLVSGTAADLLKVVLGTIFAELPRGWEVLTSTHDSVMLMVPEVCERAPEHEASWWLKGRMEQPIPWLDGRTFRCDVKIGTNWAQVS
jgi:DNA polymerase I-like protein with 3'-5' exonuclease and polymerase domains